MFLVGIARKAYWLLAGRVQDVGPQSAEDLAEPTADRLGLYCVDFRPALRSGHFAVMDDAGIPQKDFGNGDRHHVPTRVAGYALACLQEYAATGDQQWCDRFFTQADWLLASAQPHPSGSLVWPYTFGHGQLSPGWISAMAQGQVMSVLVRAFLLTGQDRYLATASRALPVFGSSVADGGLVSYFADGDPVYEETPTLEPCRILNGWVFALWGLKDLHIVADDDSAGEYAERGVASLKEHLDEYDTGWWSTYDLPADRPARIASYHYHVVHIWQLQALAVRTGEGRFSEVASRWFDYAHSLPCRSRAVLGKTFQRMAHGY